MTKTQLSYSTLDNMLRQNAIALSAAEIHGFLSGLVCGNVSDENWLELLYRFTHDNHAYPTALLNEVVSFYQQIKSDLSDFDLFCFSPLLPESGTFERVEAVCDWVNHFLLGLGLAQPTLDNEVGDVAEVIGDLQKIAQLGYNDEEKREDVEDALEEIIEYVRMVSVMLFTHFGALTTEVKPPVYH